MSIMCAEFCSWIHFNRIERQGGKKEDKTKTTKKKKTWKCVGEKHLKLTIEITGVIRIKKLRRRSRRRRRRRDFISILVGHTYRAIVPRHAVRDDLITYGGIILLHDVGGLNKYNNNNITLCMIEM